MKLRYKLILPLVVVFFVSFSAFVAFLVLDQSNKKRSELMLKHANTTDLVAMTTEVHLWNMDQKGMDGNLTSFAKDRDIVAIEIKDIQGKSVIKFEKPDIKPVLVTRQADIIHEGEKIGTASVTITDAFERADLFAIGRLMAVSGTFVFALLVILMIILANYITKPINTLLRVVTDMAEGEGNLSIAIEAGSNDEIGRLSGHFNTFLGKLKTIVVNLKAVGRQSQELGHNLAANTTEVSASAEEITKTVQSMGSRIAYLNDEIRKSTQSINTVNGNIEKVAALIDDQASSVNESSAAIEQMIANVAAIEHSTEAKLALTMKLSTLAKNSAESMAKNVSAMDEISKSTEVISEMITVIDDVASRTNLLAMNAAIEAAHAGDYGRGFSVVADEIRKLAEQTTANSKTISTSLTAIIGDIRRTSSITAESSRIIGEVIHGIEDVAGGMNETISGLQEISIGNGQITEALSALNKLTEDVRGSSGHMKEGTGNIENSFAQIAEIAAENKRGIDEMTVGIGDISASIIHLSELSLQNSRNITAIDAEMAKFKT
jgi:methyl-accepting chemotaxis protein